MPFRTILAADDSSGVLEALTLLFGPPSYRVVHAPNGKGALSLARAVRPDLVITDMILRALTGIEFVRELRRDANLAGTPVILWSAGFSPRQINGFACGCEPFTALDKFGDLDGLVSAVTKLLGLRKARAGVGNAVLHAGPARLARRSEGRNVNGLTCSESLGPRLRGQRPGGDTEPLRKNMAGDGHPEGDGALLSKSDGTPSVHGSVLLSGVR
jgi:CheY-like chemotaxis protein